MNRQCIVGTAVIILAMFIMTASAAGPSRRKGKRKTVAPVKDEKESDPQKERRTDDSGSSDITNFDQHYPERIMLDVAKFQDSITKKIDFLNEDLTRDIQQMVTTIESLPNDLIALQIYLIVNGVDAVYAEFSDLRNRMSEAIEFFNEASSYELNMLISLIKDTQDEVKAVQAVHGLLDVQHDIALLQAKIIKSQERLYSDFKGDVNTMLEMFRSVEHQIELFLNTRGSENEYVEQYLTLLTSKITEAQELVDAKAPRAETQSTQAAVNKNDIDKINELQNSVSLIRDAADVRQHKVVMPEESSEDSD